jgi:phospholipid/cholesterol/gamma-HCH transport system substrate-binding protein
MKFSIRFADQIVGTLVILALAILVVVIFMLGRNQRWFMRDYQYVTYFTSAAGLAPNMGVQYKGFTIGHVKRIMLAEDDSVQVNFTIFEEHIHRVREGSMVEIQASPIGLGNSFIFYPGTGTELLIEGSVIPEINSPQARMLIASGLAERPESTDSINNILNHVNNLLDIINVSLAGSQQKAAAEEKQAEEMTLGQILGNVETITAGLDSLLYDLLTQLNPILANIETLTDQVAEPSGTIMSILDGEGPIYNDLVSVIGSVEGMIGNFERVTDFLPGMIPQITLLLSDVHSALREAEKLIVSLTNNPLLRGGVPQSPAESGPGAATPRNLEF